MLESNLTAKDVQWVVNSNGELGVKIGQQFFWLYKGESLLQEGLPNVDEPDLKWRSVFKREFGEVCRPFELQSKLEVTADNVFAPLSYREKCIEEWAAQYMWEDFDPLISQEARKFVNGFLGPILLDNDPIIPATYKMVEAIMKQYGLSDTRKLEFTSLKACTELSTTEKEKTLEMHIKYSDDADDCYEELVYTWYSETALGIVRPANSSDVLFLLNPRRST